MKISSQKGIGLIETTIALLLIAIVIGSLIRLQIYISYSNGVNQQENTAIIIAKDKLETIKDYRSLTGANSYASIANGAETVTGKNTEYTVTWNVTTWTDPSVKQIDVTVTWTDRRSTAHTIELSGRVQEENPSAPAQVMG